jgi:DNA-binding phage protein
MSTAPQFETVLEIAKDMSSSGLPEKFVRTVLKLALTNGTAASMMEIWSESSGEDRDEAVVALQDLVDDLERAPTHRVQRPKISYKNIPEVATSIAAHKKKLRALVARNGGVVAVAARSGIPQPSLSRMLNNGSMPKKSTLFRLARALDADETEIVGEYTLP